MKFATYLHDGSLMVGVLSDGRVHRLVDQRPLEIQLADGGPKGAVADPGGIALHDVVLQAPLRPRRNIFCVGWNYVSHFEEGQGKRGEALDANVQLPEVPTFFTKATETAAGPVEGLPLHGAVTDRLDWEVELAVVIGRGGRDIAQPDALDHVFGYMVANDVSAREVQRRHGGQWFKGKSLDKCCPMGPVLVSKDEIPDPHALELGCRINHVDKQRASTRQMHFQIPRIIADLSAGMTLLPGDIILTGTPEGVGFTREPPEFLHAGDVMETWIEGLGTMTNHILA